MSKKRKHADVPETSPFSGLYSRQILRAVIDALDLGEGHILTGRTARRFLRDSTPNGHNRREFFLALGQTLQDMGFVPDLAVRMPLQVPSARVYADAVELAAGRWDTFMSRIRSEGSQDVDVGSAARCFLGLAAVDLGLRLFALNWMAGINVRLPDIPLWAEDNGIGRMLRSRLSDAGLTRGQLAVRLEVSETTVDNWLDGRNWPSREYVDPLALEFACGDPDLATSLAGELRREFALGKLCQLLAEQVGREYLVSSVDAVSSFARDLSEHVGPRFVSEKDRPVVAVALLARGSESSLSGDMLRFLAAGYPDGAWKHGILAATLPWYLAYGLFMKNEGASTSTAAGLAQDYLDVVNESELAEAASVRKAILVALMSEMDSLVPLGPLPGSGHDPLSLFEDGIAQRRRLVERFPSGAEAHSELGSFLGMVGKRTGIRELVDLGLLECRVASGLCPVWDLPAVERGIMLTNFGAHEEALLELEQVGRDLPSLTPHWRFAMGYVLMELARFSEGLEHLEAVIRVGSGHAGAYNHAARCAFGVGDGVRGRRYAKEAHRLGESEVYEAWRRGDYLRWR